MVYDFVKEATCLLGMLAEDQRKEIPVPVYDLAAKSDVGVYVRKNESNENNLHAGQYKAYFLTKESVKNNKGITLEETSGDYTFVLMLDTESPLERRLLTAYYVALLHLCAKSIEETDDIEEPLRVYMRESFNLNEINTSNNPVYMLALHLLIPQGALERLLRENGLTYRDAINSTSFIEQLSKEFLVPVLDVTKRLEAGQGANC